MFRNLLIFLVRNDGIFDALLDISADDAFTNAKGIKILKIQCDALRARRLYEKQGYKKTFSIFHFNVCIDFCISF